MPIPLFTSEKPSTSTTAERDLHPSLSESEVDRSRSTSARVEDEDKPVATAQERLLHGGTGGMGGTESAVGGSASGGGARVGGGGGMSAEEAERVYLERMEEEYAKREGGA